MRMLGRILAVAMLVLVASCGAFTTARPTTGGASAAPASAQTPALTPERERLLRDLIARANQEGSLEAEIVDSAMPATAAIRDAFVSRFAPLGLNIQVNLGAANQPTVWAAAQAAIASGGVPQYDAMLGRDDSEVLPSLKRGMLQPIENWQELLAAIDPAVADGTVKPEDRSAEPFTGSALVFDDRLKILLYNPEMIAKDQLPKTYLDLADARYKGQFVVPPWATSYSNGAYVYGKDRWLETITAIGQNAAGVATYTAGAQQMLAKQVAFQQANQGEYYTQHALGPNVPVDYAWFTDFTGWASQYYVVPVRAKHPAAATLFALFMTTDQGRAAWAPAYVAINIRGGHLPVDEQTRQAIADSKTKLVDWFGTPEARSMLEWLDTPEGEAYLDRMNRALTRRG
jgi:ABC-type Fe3+ transport system substrate-binding protein